MLSTGLHVCRGAFHPWTPVTPRLQHGALTRMSCATLHMQAPPAAEAGWPAPCSALATTMTVQQSLAGLCSGHTIWLQQGHAPSLTRCTSAAAVQCAESAYISSRPFRVNAGPVHAYCHMPGGKTAYLSELRAGAEVAVVAADGSVRTELVGRCKVRMLSPASAALVGTRVHAPCMLLAPALEPALRHGRCVLAGTVSVWCMIPGIERALALSRSKCRYQLEVQTCTATESATVTPPVHWHRSSEAALQIQFRDKSVLRRFHAANH